MTATGFIETWGLIPAIEAADAMLKAADVRILERTQVGSGLVTVTVAGSVSAVQASVEAGAAAVGRIPGGVLVSRHVIARPDEEVSAVVRTTPAPEAAPEVVSEPAASEPAKPEVEEQVKPAPVTAEPVSVEPAPVKTRSRSALKKMKVAELKKLARELTGSEAKSATKKDLIDIIINVYRKIEE